MIKIFVYIMKKYPSINYPSSAPGLFADGKVYVQEKIDGANGRFTLEENINDKYSIDEREIVFGSRNMAFKNMKDEPNRFLECIEYVRENVDIDVLRKYDSRYNGIILYGEYMVSHTIREGYNWDRWQDKFVGFDIWSINQGKFLNPEDSARIFEEINLHFSSIICSYSTEKWENGQTKFHNEKGEWLDGDNWCPKSNFGDGQAEGIVLKNDTTSTYAKMVREDFKEKQKDGKNTRTGKTSGAKKLSYQYIPDARIEKTAHKLVDEGDWSSLSMNMMKDLPKMVIKDMLEEEGFNLFLHESWEIDLEEFRSITSDRCSKILRQMIYKS
jgi:hypothetical protein